MKKIICCSPYQESHFLHKLQTLTEKCQPTEIYDNTPTFTGLDYGNGLIKGYSSRLLTLLEVYFTITKSNCQNINNTFKFQTLQKKSKI